MGQTTSHEGASSTSPPLSSRSSMSERTASPHTHAAPTRQHSAPHLLALTQPPSPPASATPPTPPSPPQTNSPTRTPGLPTENLVPTIFEWRGGGQTVHVRGTWDNYLHVIALDDNGDEHIALAYLPPGEYHFRYEVDGTFRHAPHLPSSADEAGHAVNTLTVLHMQREYNTACGLHDSVPVSPAHSYARPTLPDFLSDPPALPPHLEARSLKPLPEDISPSVRLTPDRPFTPLRPATPTMACPAAPGVDPAHGAHAEYRPFFSHVFIDHLYDARNQDDGVESLSQTFRFGSKVINTVFVSQRRGPGENHCVVDMPP